MGFCQVRLRKGRAASGKDSQARREPGPALMRGGEGICQEQLGAHGQEMSPWGPCPEPTAPPTVLVCLSPKPTLGETESGPRTHLNFLLSQETWAPRLGVEPTTMEAVSPWCSEPGACSRKYPPGSTCAVEGAETRVGRARLTTGVHTGKGGLAEPPEQPHMADRSQASENLCEAGLLWIPCLDEKEGIEGLGPQQGRLVETAHPPCLPRLTGCSACSFPQEGPAGRDARLCGPHGAGRAGPWGGLSSHWWERRPGRVSQAGWGLLRL